MKCNKKVCFKCFKSEANLRVKISKSSWNRMFHELWKKELVLCPHVKLGQKINHLPEACPYILEQVVQTPSGCKE